MIKQLKGTIEAVTPIVHHGDEKTGSTPVLRSLTHWDVSRGEHVRLPYFSGNAIRGILRRYCMRDFLNRLNYDNKSSKLHHALFTGGLLESTSDTGGKLDMNMRKMVRDMLPPVALFGTAIGNQIFDSCMKVAHAMPICSEYAACIPDIDDPRKYEDVRTFTDVAFATRRDDLRAERKDDEQAHQMKIEFEAFISGTAFVHSFTLVAANEVETSCLGHVLDLWELQPYIGGKSASGHGVVRFEYSNRPDATAYLTWIDEHFNDATEALMTLSAVLDGREPGTLEV